MMKVHNSLYNIMQLSLFCPPKMLEPAKVYYPGPRFHKFVKLPPVRNGLLSKALCMPAAPPPPPHPLGGQNIDRCIILQSRAFHDWFIAGMWVIMCAFIPPFSLNLRPHTLHPYGVSPVCTRECISSCDGNLNTLPHTLHAATPFPGASLCTGSEKKM